MKKSQILALLILLATGNGIHAAWIGYNNPFDEQIFEDNDSIQSCGDSFQESINQRDRSGVTLLLQAVQLNNIQKVEILIGFDADVNWQNQAGWTSLHYAIENNAVEMSKLLIANGANINKKNIFGNTPLHCASMGQKNEVVQLLVAAGANTTITNKWGCTARELITSPKTRAIFDEADPTAGQQNNSCCSIS